MLSLSLIKQKMYYRAIEIIKNEIETYPMNLLYLQYLGIIYYEVNNYHKASEIFQRILIINPMNPENIHNLNIAYQKLNYAYQSC